MTEPKYQNPFDQAVSQVCTYIPDAYCLELDKEAQDKVQELINQGKSVDVAVITKDGEVRFKVREARPQVRLMKLNFDEETGTHEDYIIYPSVENC